MFTSTSPVRNTNKNLVPPMMLARGNLSISSEIPIEYFAVLHSIHIDHAPTRNAAATAPTNLPAKQSHNPILNAVIVRFDNAFVVFIYEPDQPLILNYVS